MWNWLKPSIDRGIKRGIDKAIAEYDWNGAIDRILAKPEYKWFWFVKHMQARMMEVDKTLSGQPAYQIALRAYKDFLHDEKIVFDDPRYSWDEDGARDLIQAMEIDHWESTP